MWVLRDSNSPCAIQSIYSAPRCHLRSRTQMHCLTGTMLSLCNNYLPTNVLLHKLCTSHSSSELSPLIKLTDPNHRIEEAIPHKDRCSRCYWSPDPICTVFYNVVKSWELSLQHINSLKMIYHLSPGWSVQIDFPKQHSYGITQWSVTLLNMVNQD